MNYDNIINSLPSSWQELKLKDYLKLIDLPITEETGDITHDLFVGVNNTLKALNVLTGLSIEVIEGLELSIVNKMASKLSFLNEFPDPSKLKGTLRLKNIDEATYNDYLVFLTHSSDPLHNIKALIKTFSKDELKDEQLDELPVSEVHHAFFLLNRSVWKSIRNIIHLTAWQLAKENLKKLYQHYKKILKPRRKKSINSTDSTSYVNK